MSGATGMQGDAPRLRIVVSCHKDFSCPKGDIYLPVQVGVATASVRLVGTQPDDEGDNISARNFTFCELTAQYWAWKNLQADYIGMCHYRRYFCFDGARHVANDHKQIEQSLLDAKSAHAYGLDSEKLIRHAIKGVDAIVPPTWNVGFTRTPAGVKRTVREHMIGYGLVTDEILDRLLALVESMSSEYLDDVQSYLAGKHYRGYNCFIMRRPLFERLCAFEFPILQEFDRTFSYEGLTSQQKRVCGYLGEILFSAFVGHLKAEGARIEERPLVFFEHTDEASLLAARQIAPKKSLTDYLLPPRSRRRLFVGILRNVLSR